MERTSPGIFAHRGASARCPENTLAAFGEAVRIGADGIELDVHLSRDGSLIVCHDETVDRTTGGTGFIRDLPDSELRKLDAGSWFSPEFAGERMPFLEQVLALLRDHDIILNIELKTDFIEYEGIEEKTADLVRRHDMADRIIISSFNHHSLLRAKRAAPHIPVGVLYQCRPVRPERYARELGFEALHPVMRTVTPDLVRSAREAGIRVNAWLPGEQFDSASAESRLASGVTALITNYPAEYLALRSSSGPTG